VFENTKNRTGEEAQMAKVPISYAHFLSSYKSNSSRNASSISCSNTESQYGQAAWHRLPTERRALLTQRQKQKL